MYKNQLQELAQRSCFNLPSYACIREGPDHAPRFKASVNFNGEIFESLSYCPTLRQAEHAAAEVALNVLSTRGPSRSLTARVLDETGIYKNLLQETAHRAGLKLPVYTTVRSGPGHVPTFTCTVELAGMNFTGEPAKTKKQAEKNAAIAAWSALNQMPKLSSLATKLDTYEEQEQANVTRVLSNFRPKDDGKQVRRRDQNPPKRIFRGHRDIGSSSHSSSNICLQDERWKLMDLLMDLGQEGSLQKQNTFASLLPPPPPRTASKILPLTPLKKDNPSPSHCPTSPNRPIPVQVRSRSYVIPPPLEDHQKDEEEWLGIKPNVIKPSPSEKESLVHSNPSAVYGASSTYKPSPLSKLNAYTTTSTMSSGIKLLPASSHLPRTMFTGQSHPHRIAPAVQIRSVIPVCAAPPPSTTNPRTTTTRNETSQSASSSTTLMMSTQPGAEVSSATSSKFNKPQFSLLGSEFNKLQL
ncbi:Double-stranded RNA-binding domain containing protein [Trema orientale]|uniref:Double-stranded RNA-binding domain containing protein n=1 Tax=Trema orientale TaxID=63057 RepID=A0A2P5FCB7_TREOI|nr:Double-stranded RNA-binding domain containing protein [Trema orientale]